MTLLPIEDKAAIDPVTKEPFWFRGWMDDRRCTDGKTYTLRITGGNHFTFEGKPIAAVVGRERPTFKLIPRYVDLTLYRTSKGSYICHRRWVSEAYGETPVHFDAVVAPTLEDMRDGLMNYDPTLLAHTLWPEDDPATARRAFRAKKWIKESYAARVRALLEQA